MSAYRTHASARHRVYCTGSFTWYYALQISSLLLFSTWVKGRLRKNMLRAIYHRQFCMHEYCTRKLQLVAEYTVTLEVSVSTR
jgi:hypothetical protein